MSDTQLTPCSIVAEFLHSIGIELAVFAATLLVAIFFRGVSFGKQGVRAQKIVKSPRRAIQAEECAAVNVESAVSIANKKPKVQTRSPIHELTRMLDSMVGSANRWQAADAIALYEGMRAQGQSDVLRKALSCCRETLPEVFSKLIQCAMRVDKADLIEPILEDMKDAGAERSLAFYEGIMKTLASKKLYREAMSVCSRLDSDGLTPSLVTLSCLVNFAVEIGEYDKAVAFFDQLSATSIPSIRACMTILRVHSKRNDWARSHSLIRDLQQRHAHIDCLVLNIVLATGVAAGQLDAAKSLLNDFSQIVDAISYNTVLKGFAQQKDVDGAIKVLDEMCQTGVKPNTITFNTVMDAAVRSSRVADAWAVLAKMREAGLSPDKFTCTTLLKGLQDGTTSAQLKTILDVLEDVTTECDPSLCSFLFRSVIEASVRLDDPALKARAAKQMRETRNALPVHEYQRLVQLVTRERPTSCANRVSPPPWRVAAPRAALDLAPLVSVH